MYQRQISDEMNVCLQEFPAIVILGPRQVGKTTLARQFAKQHSQKVEFFDLENPTHLKSLETPMLTLLSLIHI